MKLGRWSTTAGNNNTTPPDGWPEGQAPSTVNDCAREMMASVRTVFNDAQFFDQDFTPTFATTSSFTVAGDQTSAIHAGRRLKLFDASTMYATVTTASFTAVTTIHVATDSGNNLTTSLSSFAIAILSTKGIPQGGSLSVAAVAAANTAKAWVQFQATAGGTSAQIKASYNVTSVSRSATGTYIVNFTNAMEDGNYVHTFQVGDVTNLFTMYAGLSKNAASAKVRLYLLTFSPAGAALSDNNNSSGYSLAFFR